MVFSAKNQTLANKVSVLLGNKNPKPAQIKLIESLLFKSTINQALLFHKNLTTGERNCLLLAATGNTIKQSAALLEVKDSTIMSLRKRVLKKLQCCSMSQAVFMGIRYGYCSPSLSFNKASKKQALLSRNVRKNTISDHLRTIISFLPNYAF